MRKRKGEISAGLIGSHRSPGHHTYLLITKEITLKKTNNGSKTQRLLGVVRMLFKSEGKQWTGYINQLCLSLCATMCYTKLRLMKHFCSSQLPGLPVLPMLEFQCRFIQKTLVHPQKEQEKCQKWKLSLVWLRSAGFRSAKSLPCCNSAQCTGFLEEMVAVTRDCPSLGEFAHVCNCHRGGV